MVITLDFEERTEDMNYVFMENCDKTFKLRKYAHVICDNKYKFKFLTL